MIVSRFRHTQAQTAKPDKHFINVNPTGAIWDCSNLLACNTEFIAVPWATLGSTAVFRHVQNGKVASNPALLVGHAGPVIDVTFDPFNESFLYTASEDGTIKGWSIPVGGLTESITASNITLKGHSKKVGILAAHPSASGVLGSAGADQVINIWDVERGTSQLTVSALTDQPMSLDWNLDGSLVCTTTRDKKLSVADPRSGKLVASTNSHAGSKAQRCIWAKRRNRIVTLGFDERQGREMKVWDARSLSTHLHRESVDQSSCVMMPLYDEDTELLFVGSKGDGTIKSYDLSDDAAPLNSCSSYQSPDPQKGLCMLPKRVLDFRQCEIARFYKLGPKSLVPVHMYLPRKQADFEFQADVYPPSFSDQPALTAAKFFDGACAEPIMVDMKNYFSVSAGTSTATASGPASAPAKATAPSEPVAASTATAAAVTMSTSHCKPSVSKLMQRFTDPVSDQPPERPRATDAPVASSCPPPSVVKEGRGSCEKLAKLVEEMEKHHEAVSTTRQLLASQEKELMRVIAEIAHLSNTM